MYVCRNNLATITCNSGLGAASASYSIHNSMPAGYDVCARLRNALHGPDISVRLNASFPLHHLHTRAYVSRSLAHPPTCAPSQKGGDASYIADSDTREAKAMAREQDRWLNETLVSERIGLVRQADRVPLATHANPTMLTPQSTVKHSANVHPLL